MQIQTFPIIEPLKESIEKIWLFTSENSVGEDDLKMIVPNGRIKLIIPFNDVLTRTGTSEIYSAGNRIFLVGIIEAPRVVNDQKQNPSGTIGVEFNPAFAYRFFPLDFAGITNNIVLLSHIIGGEVNDLEQSLSLASTVEIKMDMLQQFLLKQMKQEEDTVFSHCIQKIETAKGQITMSELEKAMGYTGRWLNMKFKERLGISPKNFAGIIRFNEIYKSLNTHPIRVFSQKEFYDLYHDQSHFIKDFKKFAGMPPARLTKAVNDFGKTFFKA